MDILKTLLTLTVALVLSAGANAQNATGSYASIPDGSQTVVASSGSLLPGTDSDRLWSDEGDDWGWRHPCQPCLSITAEALFLEINRAGNRALVVHDVTQDPLMSTGALNPGMVGGPRLTLRRTLPSGRMFEASYFGLHEWETNAVVTGGSVLSLPAPLGPATQDYAASSIMTASLTSRIHNAEFNLVYPTSCCGFSILGGFRYFNLDERFNLNSEDVLDGTSDYRIGTDSHLYGGQVGANLKRRWSHLELEFLGKVGVFGSDARQRAFLGDNGNTSIFRDLRAQSGQAAFIGELGFNGALHITETLFCRAGYNLIWVDGVARATDQLDFTNTALSSTVLHTGSAFFHGVNVGLEARW